MPLATISVTEDMATAMRLHALGLEQRLPPRDPRPRARPGGPAHDAHAAPALGAGHAAGHAAREPARASAGLSAGQRLMYFATMWSYLSGFAAVVYLAAPVIYLVLRRPAGHGVERRLLRPLPAVLPRQPAAVPRRRAGGSRPGAASSTPSRCSRSGSGRARRRSRTCVFGRPLGFAVTRRTAAGRAARPGARSGRSSPRWSCWAIALRDRPRPGSPSEPPTAPGPSSTRCGSSTTSWC